MNINVSLYEYVSPRWRIVARSSPPGNLRLGRESTEEIVNPRSLVPERVLEGSPVLPTRDVPSFGNAAMAMQPEEPLVSYKKVPIVSPTAHCRGLLQIGKLDQARREVERLSTQTAQEQDSPRELSYLKAWIACLQERWSEASQLLDSLLNDLAMKPVGVSQNLQERIAHCWFSLGRIALVFTFPYEAQSHLTRCLHGIKRYRVHMPHLRIEAHILFGQTLLETGQYQWAFEHFCQAERIYATHQDPYLLPLIWVGQAWIDKHTGDRVAALVTIQKTLDWAEIQRERIPLVDIAVLLRHFSGSDEPFQVAWKSYMRVYAAGEQLLPLLEKVQIACALLHLSLQLGDRTYIPTFLAQFTQWLDEVQEPIIRTMLLRSLATIHATEDAVDDLERLKERLHAIRLLKQAMHELVETRAIFLMRTCCVQVSAIYEEVNHLQEALFYAKMVANF